MQKYNQRNTEATVETWRRAMHMTLYNDDLPRLEIAEEDRTLITTNGQIINEYVGQLSYTMTDPSVQIPIIDPNTFEQTDQTFSAGQYYLLSASIYIWLAKLRDDKNNQTEELLIQVPSEELVNLPPEIIPN